MLCLSGFKSRKMSQMDTEHHVSVGLEHVML